jgi:mannonate dehydratase
MGKTEGDKEFDSLCEYIKFLGKESVIPAAIGYSVRPGPEIYPGRYQRAHRGGYLQDAFSLELMRRELAKRDMDPRWAHYFKEKPTPEEYFDDYVRFLKRIVPVAEDSGVKLMMHFDDPPVSDSEGLPPGITNPLMIDRLLEAVPSKNLGLLFCCGTRYESGVNIYEQIRHFGSRGKIFFVHFRNVRGTIPSAGGYEEVALDDGDMDMFKVLKTLKEVGYEGALSPDHMPTLVGDEKGRAMLAFAIGYIKALISALS